MRGGSVTSAGLLQRTSPWHQRFWNASAVMVGCRPLSQWLSTPARSLMSEPTSSGCGSWTHSCTAHPHQSPICPKSSKQSRKSSADRLGCTAKTVTLALKSSEAQWVPAPEKEPCRLRVWEVAHTARWLSPHRLPSTSPAGCCVAGGLEYGCVGRFPREPAAGERPPTCSRLRRVPPTQAWMIHAWCHA